MEFVIDEWYDWWRLGILVVSAICFILLVRQLFTCRDSWAEKSRDIWYVGLMWTVAAAEMQIEGLARDTGLRFRLIFVTAAILVTLRLLTKQTYQTEQDNQGEKA